MRYHANIGTPTQADVDLVVAAYDQAQDMLLGGAASFVRNSKADKPEFPEPPIKRRGAGTVISKRPKKAIP